VKLKIIILSFLSLLLTDATRVSAQQPPVSDPQTHTGTVLESTIAGKYIYIRLKVGEKEVWLSTLPEFLKVKISKGDLIEYQGGIPMQNFTSKALNRTFESILLITKIKVVEMDSIKVPEDEYHKVKTADITHAVPPSKGEIEKAKDGRTIAEIFAEREALKGKEVILQARVMKVSKRILKKNWVSLQDGTGTSPDNNIIFTTLKDLAINDVITVKGIIKTDVNLGGNYKYKVLIEDIDLPR
jgi:hypothetical protein